MVSFLDIAPEESVLLPPPPPIILKLLLVCTWRGMLVDMGDLDLEDALSMRDCYATLLVSS